MLPITVVALATTPWIARHLPAVPEPVERVWLPGLCLGDLAAIHQATGRPVERGPGDLRDLPDFLADHPLTPTRFAKAATRPDDYGRHDIAILAEINHGPRLTLRGDPPAGGSVSPEPGPTSSTSAAIPAITWSGVGDAVRLLRDEGLRVSIDSFDPAEVEAAVARRGRAGAERQRQQRRARRATGAAKSSPCPTRRRRWTASTRPSSGSRPAGVPFRIDPVLEPIGFGFAASLGRYLEVRRRYPDAEMMMGVGNLTELTDVDSAGVNVLLLGFCQELGIRSVLTTEVINWCRSCVRELDLARRLVYHAVHASRCCRSASSRTW